jgi:histidinol phosphatase-like enzyme (inositol monophosphatase family)
MSKPDWQELTCFAIALANASATEILPWFRRNADIALKAGPVWDPVTEGDRAGERIMRAMIEARYPDHGINGEEYGAKEGLSGFTWILDPVDGTRSFVCGMPTWATLIGLSFEGRPVIGLMNQPFVRDMFYGNPEGAWLDHGGDSHAIRTRTGVSLASATIGTTAPELYRAGLQQAAFERLRNKAQLTRYGGDAYFFALLSAGHIDIAMDANLQAYDIAPLLPIIRGAGGAYAEWSGGVAANGGNVITAGSQALLEEALAVMAG